MSNYIVYEPDSVDDELENNKQIKVNDTIEYISNNQEGYEKYKVVFKNGKKDLELISTYDDMDVDFMEGGRKRTSRKRTSRKRTSRKRTSRKRTSRKRTSRKRTSRKQTSKKRSQ